jgi:hypothetical protein
MLHSASVSTATLARAQRGRAGSPRSPPQSTREKQNPARSARRRHGTTGFFPTEPPRSPVKARGRPGHITKDTQRARPSLSNGPSTGWRMRRSEEGVMARGVHQASRGGRHRPSPTTRPQNDTTKTRLVPLQQRPELGQRPAVGRLPKKKKEKAGPSPRALPSTLTVIFALFKLLSAGVRFTVPACSCSWEL